jgi:hypothetical protein
MSQLKSWTQNKKENYAQLWSIYLPNLLIYLAS